MGKNSTPQDESDVHNSRGIELADRGWLEEAVKEFKKAIALDPNTAHAHNNLGTVLAEQGNLLNALEHFLAAIKAEPESANTHHYLASFLSSFAVPLALQEYRQALSLDDDFADAHLNLAMTLSEQGENEEAIEELMIAHLLAPDDELIEHELACTLMELERFPEAIGHLKQIVKRYPSHVEAFVDLGIAYTAQGFYEEAENILSKGLEIDSHDVASHYHLAGLYATWGVGNRGPIEGTANAIKTEEVRGRHDDAFDHLKIALQYEPDKVYQWLLSDKLFEPLHNDKRYTKLCRALSGNAS